jgi:hypothetical protein
MIVPVWIIVMIILFFCMFTNFLFFVIGRASHERPMTVHVFNLVTKPGKVVDEYWKRHPSTGWYHGDSNEKGFVDVHKRYGPFGMIKPVEIVEKDEFLMLPDGKHGIYGLSRLKDLDHARFRLVTEALWRSQCQVNALLFDNTTLRTWIDKATDKRVDVVGKLLEKSRPMVQHRR